MRCRRRPTLPRSLERSTIGAVGLNDRVRDGNGCGPYALVASEKTTTENGSVRVMADRMIVRSCECSAVVIPAPSFPREKRGSSQAARAIRMG